MGNASQFNPKDLAGQAAQPDEVLAREESKLYGSKSEPVFEGEIPSEEVLADVEAQEVGSEYHMQNKLFKQRGDREGGSGGGQGGA